MAGTFEKPVRGLPYIVAFELPGQNNAAHSAHHSHIARLAGGRLAGIRPHHTITWFPNSTALPVGMWKKSVALVAFRARKMNK